MIDQKQAPANVPPVIAQIKKTGFANALREVLPKHLTPERVIRLAQLATQKNKALLACTPESFATCVIVASQLGLEVNGPLGEAYLIPFGKECTLIIGYRGLIGLMHRSGLIKSISAYCVYANDAFEIEYGTTPRINHSPCLSGDTGELIGAYAIVTLPDGATQFDYMRLDEILAIKKRSRSGNGGPWVTDFNEMSKKSVVKRLSKYIPMFEQTAASNVIQADNLLESGVDIPVDVDMKKAMADDEEYADYTESEDAK